MLTLWSAKLILQALLSLVMALRRLPYPWFRTWIAASFFRGFALELMGDSRSRQYTEFFIVTEPVLLALSVATVNELFQKRLRGYRVSSWFATGVLWLGTFAAVGMTLLSFLTEPGPADHLLLQTVLALIRTTDGLLAGFLIATWLVFRVFRPGNATVNLERHHVILMVYSTLLVVTYGMLWAGGSSAADRINPWLQAVTLGCYAAWLLWLTKDGEGSNRETPGVQIGTEMAEAEERLATAVRRFRGTR